jgi:GNAT superfamily N-acetyltransferase
MPSIEVKELTPELRDTLLTFFERDAFADHPKWASCFCFFPHAPHDQEKWPERTAAQNRADTTRMIDARTMRGYVAFVDGKAVGWCNANDLTRYTITDDPGAGEPGHVGGIACFVVARPYRRTGVARALLDAAVEGFRRAGYRMVEAYPRAGTESDAENHTGPLALYLEAGFVAHGEVDGATIVRKELAP